MSISLTRDIRSESLPYKRDKDQVEKWSFGARPLHGIRINYNSATFEEELIGGTEASREKVRPRGANRSQEYKSHANKAPKPNGVTTYTSGRSGGRVSSKNDAVVDANEAATSQLSKSLLELVPQHANNPNSAIQTAIRQSAMDHEILYSFDNKGPSPGNKGRNVDLGGLVELAEKKWDSKQTEKIIKGEYEVLDHDGETTIISRKKKGSPKQKPTKSLPTVPMATVEDDGFELV